MNLNNQVGNAGLEASCSNFGSESLSERKYTPTCYETRETSAGYDGYYLPIIEKSHKSSNAMQAESKDTNENSKKCESGLSSSQQSKVKSILDSFKDLTHIEKLYFYFQMPFDPNDSVKSTCNFKPVCNFKPACNLSNNKEDQTQAFQWIRNNLEETDSNINIPKYEVYEKYKTYSELQGTNYLAAPDFGKIVKCIFPNVKARRLGTRGNSKYCYNGLKIKESKENNKVGSCDGSSLDQIVAASCVVICEWANKVLGHVFSTIVELAKYLIAGSYASTKSLSAFIVMSASKEQVNNISKRVNINSLVNVKSIERDKENITQPTDTVQVVPHTQKGFSNELFSQKKYAPKKACPTDILSPHLSHDDCSILTPTEDQLDLNDENHDINLNQRSCFFASQKCSSEEFSPFKSNTTPKKLRQKSVKNNSPYSSRQFNTASFVQRHVLSAQKTMLSTTQPYDFSTESAIHPYNSSICSLGQPYDSATQSGYSDMMSPSEIEFNKFATDEFLARNQFYAANRCQSVPSMNRTNVSAYHPLTPQHSSINGLSGKLDQMKAKRNLCSLFNEPNFFKNNSQFNNEPSLFKNDTSQFNNEPSLFKDDTSQFAMKIKMQNEVDDNIDFLKQIEKINELTKSQLEYQISTQPTHVLNIDLNDLSTPDELSDLAYSFEDIGSQELLASFST
ncbi:uncharacterized protein LOC100203591 isoform X4 [Hydra vulgaris]|uniref:Uncharacterized protein LOC100203591 isoform X4 n=1 Tax=Hydra vulgaris TaxID=6087 RepID=A0ABM4CKM2_HYDVU